MGAFHERLKLLKEESGKTQAEIANTLDITPQTLSYYFNGREPNYDMLIQLTKYFNVSSDYLLGISNNRSNEDVIQINEHYSQIMDFLEQTPNVKTEVINIAQKLFSDKLTDEEKYKLTNLLSDLLFMYDHTLKSFINK